MRNQHSLSPWAIVAVATLLLILTPVQAIAECQACWTSSPGGGQCQDVIQGSPSLMTYSNCQGTLFCYRTLDGAEFCFPTCLGDPCFWV